MTSQPSSDTETLNSSRSLSGPSLLIASLLFLGMSALPVPYIRDAPGDTFNALGTVDGKLLVKIAKSDAYPTYPTTGKLRILTVSELGGPIGMLPLGDAFRVLIDKSIQLVPTEFVFPEVTSSDQVAQQGEDQFADSQSSAVAAGLTEAGIPVTSRLRVMEVRKDGAANKILRVGDELLAIEGIRMYDFDSFDSKLQEYQKGDVVSLTVLRKDKEQQVKVKLGARKDGRPLIGIMLMQHYVGPMDIQIQLNNVGGPSAGLAMSLAIYDKVTPGDLLRGRVVAVTGTIDANGQVGAIGGVPQKMAAAKVMLLPADNCVDAKGSTPPELQLVPVTSLEQAVTILSASDKGAWPHC